MPLNPHKSSGRPRRSARRVRGRSGWLARGERRGAKQRRDERALICRCRREDTRVSCGRPESFAALQDHMTAQLQASHVAERSSESFRYQPEREHTAETKHLGMTITSNPTSCRHETPRRLRRRCGDSDEHQAVMGTLQAYQRPKLGWS